MGRYRKAIECYEMALAIDHKFTAAWFSCGNAYYSLGRFYKAIECYKQALRYSEKEYVYIINSIANAFEEMEEYYKAIEYYTRSLHTDPLSVDAYFGRGNSYFMLGKYVEAIDDYESALKIEPDDFHIWNAKADAEISGCLYDNAADSLEMVIELDNYNETALYEYISLMGRIKQYSRMITFLDEYINENPQLVPDILLLEQAKNYYLAGRKDEFNNILKNLYEKTGLEEYRIFIEGSIDEIVNYVFKKTDWNS